MEPVNSLHPKTIFAKKFTLNVWESPKQYHLLLWWILPQILTPPLNLKIWCRILVPFLLTHPPHPTIKLPRRQIFKTDFRKLLILPKLCEWRKWQGWVGPSCLRHYDALRTKIDLWLTPKRSRKLWCIFFNLLILRHLLLQFKLCFLDFLTSVSVDIENFSLLISNINQVNSFLRIRDRF